MSWSRQTRGSSGYSSPSASTTSQGSTPAKPSQNSPKWEDRLQDEAFRKFSFAELKSATENFDKSNLLGIGGFGEVYKGLGPNGQVWAVKKARPGVISGTGTSKGLKDFEREVVTMSQVSHKNLVHLLGYSTGRGEHIVVYELLERGSLANALHGSSSGSAASVAARSAARQDDASSQRSFSSQLARLPGKLGFKLNGFKAKSTGSVDDSCMTSIATSAGSDLQAVAQTCHENGNLCTPGLSFLQRVEIAAGTADALHYLHNGLQTPVVHRDIKPANILLDGNYRAKVADFGLVKLMREAGDMSGAVTAESTRVTGTRGYLDPEYWEHGKASPAVDVYSFGVVMLELLTGRKPTVSRPSDLAAMYAGSFDPGDQEAAPSMTQETSVEILDSTQKFSTECVDHEAAMGQQVPLREWVMHVRAHKGLRAILDPRMDLDLGTSSRRRKPRADEDMNGVCIVDDKAEFQRRKEEALEKGLGQFLQLGLRCTAKTAKRPAMSEVSTELQELRRALRAAREKPVTTVS